MAELHAHALRESPRECCGLLSGPLSRTPSGPLSRPTSGPLPLRYQPVRNVAAGLHRFEMDPEALLAALAGLEEGGEDLWGIVHSHPASAAVPSATDLAEAYYPDAVYLILSLAPTALPGAGLPLQPAGVLRAYRLEGETWRELSLLAVGP